MGYIPAKVNDVEGNANLKKHCEKVIAGIKKERKILRSRLTGLVWKQKRYQQLLDDIKEMKLDLIE